MFGERRLIRGLTPRSNQVPQSARNDAGRNEEDCERGQRSDTQGDRPRKRHRNRIATHCCRDEQGEDSEDGGEHHHPTNRKLLAGHDADFWVLIGYKP